MSVRMRRVDDEWLVEFKGQPIGAVTTELEARRLADYWRSKLKSVRNRRLLRSLKRALKTQRTRSVAVRRHHERPPVQ